MPFKNEYWIQYREKLISVLYISGATRTEDVKELIHARQSVVVHAKAYGLQAIDMVYINFKGINHK